MTIETDVMEAAAALKLAVDRAQAAGYHVNWPLRASDIGSIAVSETSRVFGWQIGEATGIPRVGFDVPADGSMHDLAYEPTVAEIRALGTGLDEAIEYDEDPET